MRITTVKCFPLWIGMRNVFIVKVDTDEGISGLGEGGISTREQGMQGMVDHYSRLLVGQDPRRIEHLWQRLYRSSYFEGGRITGAAISAIDIALWDILGQSLGVPIYQLLGGACRDRVPCFASVGHPLTGPSCVDQSKELVAQGWRHLRLFPGMPQETDAATAEGQIYEPMESLALAAQWLRVVRRAVGDAVALSIDFHHRLSVAEAALFCQQVADLHLMFLEEPIRAQSPAAYQQLRTMTPIPFAIGEEFSSKWEFVPFIEQGILNYARIDVCNVGGLTEAKKVAGWCEAHYIDVMPHNPLGPVCTAASIHLGVALNNFAQLEYLEGIGNAYPRDLFPTLHELAGDSFPVPQAPGLGVTLNEELAAERAFEYWEHPRYRRRDGAHTNW